MRQFDHLGVVVTSLEAGRDGLDRAVGPLVWTAPVDDPVNGVRLQFGRDPAGVVFELLEPFGDDSPVAAALRKGRDILNHVAYLVPDLAEAAEDMRRAGSFPLAPAKPAIAYGHRPIQFFMTGLGFIVELIEAAGFRHAFAPASHEQTYLEPS